MTLNWAELQQLGQAIAQASDEKLVQIVRIVDTLPERNKLDDAIEQYQKALIIREGLVGRDSNNWIWQKSLLGVQEAHAGALKAGGKLDEAIQQYRKALATGENLASREPGNAAWQARLQSVRKDLEAATAEQRRSAEQDRRSEPRLELNRSSV